MGAAKSLTRSGVRRTAVADRCAENARRLAALCRAQDAGEVERGDRCKAHAGQRPVCRRLSARQGARPGRYAQVGRHPPLGGSAGAVKPSIGAGNSQQRHDNTSLHDNN